MITYGLPTVVCDCYDVDLSVLLFQDKTIFYKKGSCFKDFYGEFPHRNGFLILREIS